MKQKKQRGVSLYLAVVLMTMLLALVLGISTVLFRQLQTIRGLEHSVVALYAADSGMEEVLVDVIGNRQDPIDHYEAILGNGSSYVVDVVCCADCGGYLPPGCGCAWSDAVGSNPCPFGDAGESASCSAYFYCVRSRGFYGPAGDRTKTQRAIQVAL